MPDMPVVGLDLHESDFHAWTRVQADLLRAGRLAEADLPNLIEELDSMGRSERNELVSRLTILLLHLLKWGGNRSNALGVGV